MATSVTTSIRYFNLINSYFEPLVDPWNFDLTVSIFSLLRNAHPLTDVPRSIVYLLALKIAHLMSSSALESVWKSISLLLSLN